MRVVSLGLNAGMAEVVLEVDNPNFFSLEVREFDYRLEVEDGEDRWANLAQGSTRESVTLPRRGIERVALEVPFDYEAVGAALRSWWNTGSVPYRIEGALSARGPGMVREFPFQARGRMAP
ncbi:MAG: LEA type 2 family protein [bacterium]